MADPVSLPIELLYFKGISGVRENRLEWSSVSEINNDYYTIYYMNDDNLNWESVATIDGAGNSSFTTKYIKSIPYEFQGINYYMLEQTDYDGNKKTYADKIIALDNRNNSIRVISKVTNLLGQEVDLNTYQGAILIIFENGEMVKEIR